MSKIATNIRKVFQSRLQTITTENGYSADVLRVERPLRSGGVDPQHRVVIVSSPLDMTINDEHSHPGNPPSVAYDLPVTCAYIIANRAEDNTPIEDLLDEAGADMVKAITSVDDWHNFDGNAIIAERPGPPTHYNPGSDGYHGVHVKFIVTFRVKETDTNELAG